ncbi:MAG: DNA mismatch repair endonuclease MutL [Caldithrix sp.]|nr:MAG: DNA mismatch repair endonuclease MutL [Caldithrix sp.]
MKKNTNNKIKILPAALSNKIAAGEVVDRPASVVKELLENSIDAGADEITIIIKQGGKALIQVLDNGSGMNESDLLMAFQRHATSKIFKYEDLTRVRTLGFRGEALASIGSVSRVEAKSVLQNQNSGHLVRFEGGVIHGVEGVAGNHGSSIAVKNLFYNTPARRKFLRADATEYRQILSVANRFFLAHSEIAFTFVKADEIIYELKKETQEERIAAVLGPRVHKNLIAIENETPVKIKGYIVNQDAFRRSRGDQYLFFNRRYFSHKSLNYAVISGYGDALQRGLFPVYLVFIEMDPELADVNVHPAKLEIKFSNEPLVFSSVRGSVKRALTSQEAVPEIRRWGTPEAARQAEWLGQTKNEAPVPENSLQLPQLFVSKPENANQLAKGETLIDSPQDVTREKIIFERTNVWQVHNKYIISQIKNGLIVIDQHVAHERILYEQALDNFEKRNPSSQQLLFPQVVQFSAEDYSILLEMIPFLEKIGFVVKSFGQNTVVLEGVPSGIKISDDEKVLLDILDEYKRGKKDNAEIRENVAKSYACHTAIRAGEHLPLEAMNALIDKLFTTKEPYFCPHGRPVIIHISLAELDRRFKRH